MFYNFFKVAWEDLSFLKKYANLLGLKVGTRLVITHFFYLLRVGYTFNHKHYKRYLKEINYNGYNYNRFFKLMSLGTVVKDKLFKSRRSCKGSSNRDTSQANKGFIRR